MAPVKGFSVYKHFATALCLAAVAAVAHRVWSQGAAATWRPGDTFATSTSSGPLQFQDGFLDEKLAEELIQYLDTHESTNPLGVVLVPAPSPLFHKFKSALAALGGRSKRPAQFAAMGAEAFSRGEGRMPGKVATAGHKGCHSDYEVDTDFQIQNVLGPTEGRVGILYLSGGGTFTLQDEATGEEHTTEVKPGRFVSWPNNGKQHCVTDDATGPPRRFLGPVVLDASATGLIPAVDILTPTPSTMSCSADSDCTNPDNPSCVGGSCCAPAGSSFVANSTFCCPGSYYHKSTTSCCFRVGSFTTDADQCCSGNMVDSICAPAGQYACLRACLKAVNDEFKATNNGCRGTRGNAGASCKHFSAGSRFSALAWCYAAGLPAKC